MKEKYLVTTTQTVEEKAQEADKVFTLHPWIYFCFFSFPLISLQSRVYSFLLMCQSEISGKNFFMCLKSQFSSIEA